MRKTDLNLALALTMLLVFMLFLLGEGSGTESRSSTFEMKSDIVCGVGGKSQSVGFIVEASAGAQGGAIGETESGSFNAAAGWVYVSRRQLPYLCGDAGGNGTVNISDAVYLITYIFGGGPAPVPYEAGDVDCTGFINIADAVYSITYIFGGGPAPCDPNGDGVPDC